MEQQETGVHVDAKEYKIKIANHWCTMNGISGTPKKEIIHFIEKYLAKKKKKVIQIADPKGSSYGKLANQIIVNHHIQVSAFTEALLYLTCSKEIFDKVDWNKKQVVISKGSFLETFGYQNQLADWPVADAKDCLFLFMKHINNTFPGLSIVLTENYESAVKRAGKNFEYKGKKAKYLKDSDRFLHIKANPILQALGIKIVNIEVNGRDPWEVFQKEIKPYLKCLE